jgi:ubiquinone/menaquinone biosynthesis C-methylase UbiE
VDRRFSDRQVPGSEEVWRKYDSMESRLTAPVSERMLDLAGIGPGMRVLDLATGRGEPALRAAQRVGPEGLVMGIELADELLQIAKEKARRSGLANLDLRAANAESVHDIPTGHFHAATVRWGLMYMAAPIAALVNARRALSPTGVLVAALWAEAERVPYYTLPRRLLERYRTLPRIDPEAPGTFRYATLEQVVRDFGQAGFMIDHVEEMDVTVFEAETEMDIIDWVRALGLAALLNDLPERDQRAWEIELTSAVRRTGSGGPLRLGGVTRIVRARRH